MILRHGGALPVLLGVLIAVSPARAEWATNGIPVCSAPYSQSRPVLCQDASGGVILAWLDNRTGYDTDIFAQRLLPSGVIAPGWPANQVPLTHITCWKYDPAILADGAGGAVVAWSDDRCRDTTSTNIYVHRVTPSGVPDPSWPADGLALCVAPHEQERPAIVSDGAGGAFVFWDDRRNGTVDIYAMRVLATGVAAPGWPADGLQVASDTEDASGPVAVSDGAGGAIVAWEDRRNGTSDIYGAHLDGTGALVPGWPDGGLGLCVGAGEQRTPCIASDAAGGAILAWRDTRSPNGDVYATRVTGAGLVAPGWQANGDPVCTALGLQQTPAIVADGAGGAVVVWTDSRTPPNSSDIYALRLTAVGGIAAGWPVDGVALCTAPGAQTTPVIAGDGTGGALVTWLDGRDRTTTGYDLYIQHVDGTGAIVTGWPSGGFAACRSPGDQIQPRIVSDGAGGAYVGWNDARTPANSTDIYVLRFAGDGPVPTQVRDLQTLHRDGQTFLTWTAPGPTGWTYRVYASSEPITSAEDVAEATLVGTIGDSTWCDRRFSQKLGAFYGYSIDSLAAPLDSTRGLFVWTPPATGSVYYAATAQPGSLEEDRDVTPGVNALVEPVAEQLALPRPVFQRIVTASTGAAAEVYTLWTSAQDTPLFPAMGNRPSLSFDFGLVRGAAQPGVPLMVRTATRKGFFLESAGGSGWNGEWVLAVDDPLPNGENTFWYGYHEGYDVTSNQNPPPTSGFVRDYTIRRLAFTVEWARRSFPVDTARVSAMGYSAGAIGAAMLSFDSPGLVASAMSVIGKYDFSFLTEPDTTCQFNPGGVLRTVANWLWGSVALDLPTVGGLGVFERLDGGTMAGRMEPWTVPPLFSFDGRNDNVLGWAEKVGFYRAMQLHRQGGTFFWDNRAHVGASDAAWLPMQDFSYLHRFRTDRSFPALSNCSADHDPGDGTPTDGDSVGTINGFVEWDTSLVDQPFYWTVTLRLRNLATLWGPVPAPESLTVDVTPRRLQRFHAVAGRACSWRVVRLSDEAVVQSGAVMPDSLLRFTMEGVKVHRAGSRLEMDYEVMVGVPPAQGPRRLSLALARNPVAGRTELLLTWPAAGAGTVDLLDVSGRRVRTLWRGPAGSGPARVMLEPAGLPSGLYFAVARADGARVSQRVIVLR